MQQIIYDLTNIIDWSNSPKFIIKQFNAKKDPGLITFFHGHIVLFQEMQALKKYDYKKPESNKIEFKLDDSGNIIISSHDLIVTKYMIDLRSDYFKKISFKNFVSFYPDCAKYEFTSSRKSLTWNEICAFESRIYDGNTIRRIEELDENSSVGNVQPDRKQSSFESEIIEPELERNGGSVNVSSVIPKFGQYTQKIFGDSKNFCEYLANTLPKNAKILDLGSSEEPWFSSLCADYGMRVFAFDMQKPGDQEFIKKKGITYIYDDINNLDKYKKILSNLDFIFCRNLSPAQRFWDWYDPNFLNIWKTMVEFINEHGVIYWIQMGEGTDIPDTFFMNHSPKYFREFFSHLGLSSKITKYAYTRFKVMKDLKYFSYPWSSHEITANPNAQKLMKKDLYKTKDYSSLVKHYAFQMQSFHEKNNFELNHTIEISGNPICGRIARILLLENFRYDDAIIVGNSDNTTLKIKGDEKSIPFILTNVGLNENEYFLIDEDEDKRFTSLFVRILSKYQLYVILRKFPSIAKIKKKYFNHFKFWSE